MYFWPSVRSNIFDAMFSFQSGFVACVTFACRALAGAGAGAAPVAVVSLTSDSQTVPASCPIWKDSSTPSGVTPATVTGKENDCQSVVSAAS